MSNVKPGLDAGRIVGNEGLVSWLICRVLKSTGKDGASGVNACRGGGKVIGERLSGTGGDCNADDVIMM